MAQLLASQFDIPYTVAAVALSRQTRTGHASVGIEDEANTTFELSGAPLPQFVVPVTLASITFRLSIDWLCFRQPDGKKVDAFQCGTS